MLRVLNPNATSAEHFEFSAWLKAELESQTNDTTNEKLTQLSIGVGRFIMANIEKGPNSFGVAMQIGLDLMHEFPGTDDSEEDRLFVMTGILKGVMDEYEDSNLQSTQNTSIGSEVQ